MKKTILIASIILSSYNTLKSQNKIDETKTNYPVVGFSTGYNVSHKSLNGGLHFGYKANKIYLSGDMFVPLARSVFVPFILTTNVGVNLSQFQPFISYGYSTIGRESEQLFKGTQDEFVNGFRFGYGIRYYLRPFPLALNVQKQGKEFVSSLTIYKSL